MNDDHLWHRKGDDPELADLERKLEGLAYRGDLPQQLPPQLPADDAPRPVLSTRRAPWLAAAAVLLATGTWLATRPASIESPTPLADNATPKRPSPSTGALPTPEPPAIAATPGWALRGTLGATTCDGGTDAACRLDVGETIETDALTHLDVADIGTMDLEPRTRLGLVATGTTEHRLKLERGTIHATVVAPPRLLVVETAASTAVDLGCSYTLSVDEHGAGYLAVETGWVALEVPGRAVHVPAGARAETRPGRGPGVPYFTDAPPAVQTLAHRLSFETGQGGKALTAALGAARPKDSLSLLHLLPQVPDSERAQILKKLVALAPDPPADLTTESLLRLDPAALERLREHLEPTWL